MSLFGEYYGLADDQDLELVARRQLNREMLADNLVEPMEGDVVQFLDGTRLRVSHVWRRYEDKDSVGRLQSVQTTDGGSFHFNESGRMSYSGGLFSPIPGDTFTWNGETAPVRVWIFHHGRVSAHRGVDVTAHVRVWRTIAPVPTS